jgi:uncharacterized membrane protein
MRTYVIVTGVVFALLTAAHVLRLFVEPHLVRDPWFVGATLISTILALMAWRVARRCEGSSRA